MNIDWIASLLIVSLSTIRKKQPQHHFSFHQLISNWEDMNSNRTKTHRSGYCINLSSTRKLTSYRTSYLWQSHKHKGIRTCCCLTSVKHNPSVKLLAEKNHTSKWTLLPPQNSRPPAIQNPRKWAIANKYLRRLMYLIQRTPLGVQHQANGYHSKTQGNSTTNCYA